MTQGVPIVVAALIAAFIAVFTNVQAQRATNTQLQIAERQLSTAEQGQITDRYNAAIKNLGSGSIEVRLGGIYALQRLMLDSPRDQPTVIAVLCAFVRDQTSPAGRSAQTPNSRPSADIQAALTVVGTRDTAHDGRATVLDFDRAQLADAQLSALHLSGADFSATRLSQARLTGADLTGADFGGAVLSSAVLRGANLSHANLAYANLTYADLRGADLTRVNFLSTDLEGTILLRANLSQTNLSSANLSGALLEGADLSRADLGGENLTRTDLSGADLEFAYLHGAYLDGTDLTRARLAGADLTDAKWSKDRPAPDGWVRDPRSGRLKRASA